jgi:hypothetical protein
MFKSIFAAVALVVLTAGCASFNNAMTPSAKVSDDGFYGNKVVIQPPVGAAGRLSDSGWFLLGMRWNSGEPDTIVFTARVTSRMDNLEALEFRADGEFIRATGLNPSSRHDSDVTVVGSAVTATQQSERDFSFSYDDFLRVVGGDEVKAKLTNLGGEYGVATFGKKYSGAVLTTKLEPFLALVDAERDKLAP